MKVLRIRERGSEVWELVAKSAHTLKLILEYKALSDHLTTSKKPVYEIVDYDYSTHGDVTEL